jgi:hypothetical protein
MRDGRRRFGDEIGRKIWGRKIGKKGANGGWRMAKGGNLIGRGLGGRFTGLV